MALLAQLEADARREEEEEIMAAERERVRILEEKKRELEEKVARMAQREADGMGASAEGSAHCHKTRRRAHDRGALTSDMQWDRCVDARVSHSSYGRPKGLWGANQCCASSQRA